ncbi:transposase [Thermacetogenium phaeum DSM 12270]|uniref:Transposase n=1 Tax=Thermacetogenium phaeum (strain ATCC BAA-254 / DSM 26808 / PB) TaxID=1089553 RepID=K4LIU9_THEPS|nr:transposase [Thermacetogenium phaeum DSM 12270]
MAAAKVLHTKGGAFAAFFYREKIMKVQAVLGFGAGVSGSGRTGFRQTAINESINEKPWFTPRRSPRAPHQSSGSPTPRWERSGSPAFPAVDLLVEPFHTIGCPEAFPVPFRQRHHRHRVLETSFKPLHRLLAPGRQRPATIWPSPYPAHRRTAAASHTARLVKTWGRQLRYSG